MDTAVVIYVCGKQSISFDRFSNNPAGKYLKPACATKVSPLNVRVYFHQLFQPQDPAKVEEDKKEVVIESGPVQYEKTDETNPVGEGEEEEEFDELEEEDEEPVSAVQLMGHLYDANVDDDYADFEDYE